MAESLDSGMDEIDSDLRMINLFGREAGPPPRSLHIDTMFDRASSSTWAKYSAGPSPAMRPPSPTLRPGMHGQLGGPSNVPLPLPLPMRDGGHGPSPLAGLFEWPELVPLVLQWFDRPGDLAILCRVSKEFERLARRRLYKHVWVRPWERDPDAKFRLLFTFFAQHPHLCRMVSTLDVRSFPLSARDSERYDIDDKVELALSQMASLESLTWTRDKSLTPALGEQIAQLRHLRTLEISGHSERYYDPALIGKMENLEELRIMMPDGLWKDRLLGVGALFHRPGLPAAIGRAQSFLWSADLKQYSPLIDDQTLKALAPYLSHLRSLTLWGTTRVTRRGVYAVLEEADYIEDLSLDATPHSDLLSLAACPDLSHVHTFSLSIAAPHRKPLFITPADLPVLPPMPSLTSLNLSISGDKAHMPRDGLAHLCAQTDFARLKRLSLLSFTLATPQISDLLHHAPGLEELFISINHRSILLECEELRDPRYSGKMRVLHVTAPERWRPDAEDLAVLAREMPALEEVGSGNRVYEVVRREGDVELVRWSRTYTPRYFQVWRG